MTNKFKPPFRVGKKQGRAVLDAEGKEVVVFPKGCEGMATEYASMYNIRHAEKTPPPQLPPKPNEPFEYGWSFFPML